MQSAWNSSTVNMLEESISLVQIIKEMKQQEAQFTSIAFKYQLGMLSPSPQTHTFQLLQNRSARILMALTHDQMMVFLLFSFPSLVNNP